ncbi:MAG: glycosyltransferase, partial [Chthoniobacterales bacterium]
LKDALQSVKQQIYTRWELCIADDASTLPGVRSLLEAEANSDSRVKLVLRAQNGHVSACSNSALALATGDWCGLLDHDDSFPAHALCLVAREVNAHPEAGVIYSDE